MVVFFTVLCLKLYVFLLQILNPALDKTADRNSDIDCLQLRSC